MTIRRLWQTNIPAACFNHQAENYSYNCFLLNPITLETALAVGAQKGRDVASEQELNPTATFNILRFTTIRIRCVVEGRKLSKESENKTNKFLLWIVELRAPFFTAVLVPVCLGMAIAWVSFRSFDLMFFVLSLAGAVCVNAGTNLANDYFDYRSGCDLYNTDFSSPFSGGSGLLPKRVLHPRDVYIASLVFFVLAGLIGVFLALTRGWIIIALGLVGVISGYFYTTQLAPRGIGEFIVGLNCGPLAVVGSYYVQTQTIALEPIVASIPVAMLITAILWINEIPDYFADARAGKKTLVTRIGRERSADIYGVLICSTYAAIVLGFSLSLMPLLTSLSLLTAPLGMRAMYVARRNYEDPRKLLPANAGTVLVHLFTGLLLCLAYVISGYSHVLAIAPI